MNLPSDALPLPEAYYDKNSGGYWYKDKKGKFVRYQQTDFIRFLKKLGYSGKVLDGEHQSMIDHVLMDILLGQNVDFAGSLAGHKQGHIEMGGKSILVTDSPKIISAKQGSYTVLETMLLNMFGPEQLPYVKTWCKLAYESLLTGNLRPGQTLVMAGPVASGKSLFQQIITEMLGGRVAHPYMSMTGATTFNSELFSAEHLVIDDQLGQSDFHTRQKLTAQFKMIAAAGTQQCHAKGKPSISLTPFWRMTVSVNIDPESLLVLPLIKDDLADKIMLFRVGNMGMPMPTGTDKERKAFWDQLIADLPGWLYHLANEWVVPPEIVGDRFGVRPFHHPEIIEAIDSLSPEMKLFSLLEAEFGRDLRPSVFTSAQIESRLIGDLSSNRYEARKLFTYNNACGVYLSRLARKYPTIISRVERDGNSRCWRIDFTSTLPVVISPRPGCPPRPAIAAGGKLLPARQPGSLGFKGPETLDKGRKDRPG